MNDEVFILTKKLKKIQKLSQIFIDPNEALKQMFRFRAEAYDTGR